MAQADDWSWERYRPLLKLQFRQLQLDPRFQRRIEGSDLVQDVFVQALQNLDQCKDQSEGERVRWLQRIFRNKAIDRIRAETAAKRDIRQEQLIGNAFAESSARWDKLLHADVSQPDKEAERREFFLQLATAADQLPADQRDAFIIIDLMGIKMHDAAAQLGRTEKSVAGLVRRARQTLCELLPEHKPSNL